MYGQVENSAISQPACNVEASYDPWRWHAALVIAEHSWRPGREHCSQAGLAQRPEPYWIPVSERL
jgi:hypothetical protein